MKIHQLPQGARFVYEGAEYVKSGPMFAIGPAGQRLIPKYAVLQPLDAAVAVSPAPTSPHLQRETVKSAFHAFYLECAALIAAEHAVALAAARERFLRQLD